jgi:hypothetical protein
MESFDILSHDISNANEASKDITHVEVDSLYVCSYIRINIIILDH